MGHYSEDEKENQRKDAKIKTICLECKNSTNHLVKLSLDRTWSEMEEFDHNGIPTNDMDGANSYQIIECQGCNSVSFRHENYCSESREPWPDGSDGISETIYPKRNNGDLPIKSIKNLSLTLRRIYRETIDCYNNESLTLCAAGVRAIIEGICSNKSIIDGPIMKADGSGPKLKSNGDVVRRNNLQGKIGGLAEKKLLTDDNANILHQHRFLGNGALHELTTPNTEQLSLAIQIIEHVLESVYEIPEKGKELKRQCERDN